MKQLREKSHVFDHGWFRLWIGLGIALAILLVVHSISDYRELSRKTLIDGMRRDMAAQAVSVDHQIQRANVRDAAGLQQALEQFRDASGERIAWLHVRDANGGEVARAGSNRIEGFSMERVRSSLRARQPLFRTISSEDGTVVVEVFPIRLPVAVTPAVVRPAADQPGPATAQQQNPARRFSVLEIAARLDGAQANLWPLQRSLLIDVSAALALLLALSVLGVRFRSYVEGRQLEAQLEIARLVQQNLLGAEPASGEFDVAAECLPATSVGGDFYDSFRAPGDVSAFVLGDVSGKGIPAALLMGVLHGAVRSSTWTDSPWHHEEATRQINRLLCERASPERFASMFWAYFDADKRLLRYVNAGHFPPLLFKADHPANPFRLSDGGPVLGLIPDARFEQGVAPLDAGDLLVLYSDGIIEASDENDEPFGEERLVALIRTLIDRPAPEIRNRILGAVEAFTGYAPRDDDRTLLVVRYSGAVARASACGAGARADSCLKIREFPGQVPVPAEAEAAVTVS